jgi:hypothetical protein
MAPGHRVASAPPVAVGAVSCSMSMVSFYAVLIMLPLLKPLQVLLPVK